MNPQILNYKKSNSIMIVNITSSSTVQREAEKLIKEFIEIYNEIIWKKSIKVLILSFENNESFIIERDSINAIPKSEKESENIFSSFAEAITKIDIPIIAAIKGDAIEEGLELALACDLRIASKRSNFGFPQIKEGFIPWAGGTQRLARLVGKGKALEMILIGETINAQEALRIGLVNRVVPEREVVEVAMKVAQEMASRAPIALRYAKEAVNKGMEMTLGQGLRLEADLYLLLHTTRDRMEGIQAFREKRAPKFEGR